MMIHDPGFGFGKMDKEELGEEIWSDPESHSRQSALRHYDDQNWEEIQGKENEKTYYKSEINKTP